MLFFLSTFLSWSLWIRLCFASHLNLGLLLLLLLLKVTLLLITPYLFHTHLTLLVWFYCLNPQEGSWGLWCHFVEQKKELCEKETMEDNARYVAISNTVFAIMICKEHSIIRFNFYWVSMLNGQTINITKQILLKTFVLSKEI